jgi:hypothetical protein
MGVSIDETAPPWLALIMRCVNIQEPGTRKPEKIRHGRDFARLSFVLNLKLFLQHHLCPQSRH